MEVYLITCRKTGKFYVGSTSWTKEERWKSSSDWCHARTAYKDDPRPLYEDIRLYGEDEFDLSTLETVESKEDLLAREDYWIKKYFAEYGADKMYNVYAGAKISGDGHQLCTPEALAKTHATNKLRYGSEFPNTPEGIAKRWRTCQEKSRGICSAEAFQHRSSEFNYARRVYYGVTQLHEQLLSEGYDLLWNMVRRLALNDYFSKANAARYPELVGAISVTRYTKRGELIRRGGA